MPLWGERESNRAPWGLHELQTECSEMLHVSSHAGSSSLALFFLFFLCVRRFGFFSFFFCFVNLLLRVTQYNQTLNTYVAELQKNKSLDIKMCLQVQGKQKCTEAEVFSIYSDSIHNTGDEPGACLTCVQTHTHTRARAQC